MSSSNEHSTVAQSENSDGGPFDALTYQQDAAQRAVLFLDVMRQRAIQYEAHAAETSPNVLEYETELICDGRDLPRPTNYVLVRIKPGRDVEINSLKRPFVVVDPRAGHGPGIGGFKADSEIGVAMKAGHHCYFIGFLPNAVPGQTIEDIALSEAVFLETVADRHPEAEGKPCVIGNCQAGWAIMMLAALRPELFGPIILAGSPLSYWAGVKGQNPMRYSGGLMGGSWLTAMTGDLGAGTFDGAWLVQNFENQNPANTLWSKQYNLYSKIDTEADRYLAFEKWWGGHITLNAEEMQFIVDELFIGNKLASGDIRTTHGTSVDLRNIRSPIVVFCSKGDNITPPQQALDWILDLYDSVDEIRAFGQTIVYTIHEGIGHLGIFVSAGVAKKEHDEFASNIDFIDILPPGLYEAVLEPVGEAIANPELVTGNWVMRCEPRTLEDIRALGGNDLETERSFAAAARVSEINLSLYRSFLQPFVKLMSNDYSARAMRNLHPLRIQYEMFGPRNPFMAWVEGAAKQVRENRKPVPAQNSFVAIQSSISEQIVSGLDAWRQAVERLSEQTFHAIYGSPGLQAAVGIDTTSVRPPRKAAKNLIHSDLISKRTQELRAEMSHGGLREALIRALLYVAMSHGTADERGFEAIRQVRQRQSSADRLPLPEFKALVRQQYMMLLIDEEAALAAIPALLPSDIASRQSAFEILAKVLEAPGIPAEDLAVRLSKVKELFGLSNEESKTPDEPPKAVATRGEDRSKSPSRPDRKRR